MNYLLKSPALGATVEERTRFVKQNGLTIKTSLDMRLQNEAQNQVNTTVPATDPTEKGAVLVTVEPGKGYVRAMAQNTIYSGLTAISTINNAVVDASSSYDHKLAVFSFDLKKKAFERL